MNCLTVTASPRDARLSPGGLAIREIIKALKAGEVVAMVGDQGGKDGTPAPFFGIPTSTPTGFVRFALNSQAVVIPAIIVRERRFSHRIILERPLKIEEEKAPMALAVGSQTMAWWPKRI